jgi:hypothetical protein
MDIQLAPGPVTKATKSVEKYLDSDIYEADRSLEHVLQDRIIGTNDNQSNLYDYNGLDDSKYSLV